MLTILILLIQYNLSNKFITTTQKKIVWYTTRYTKQQQQKELN